jgi:hypothetical protein
MSGSSTCEPVVSVYGTGGDHPSRIPPDVWQCYEALFPIEAERDDPANVLQWLDRGHSRDVSGYEWIEVLFTFRFDQTCAGVAYLSAYVPNPLRGKRSSGWWFGNYFGLLEGWRKRGNAALFLTQIAKHCESVMSRAKGIIFEVERYDERQICSALSKLQSAGGASESDSKPPTFTLEEIESIHAAMRIALYTGKSLGRMHRSEGSSSLQTAKFLTLSAPRASSFVHGRDPKGQLYFLDYIQPAMHEPLSPKNEVPLWLMMFPIGASPASTSSPGSCIQLGDVEVDELLDFLYGEVFPSAYAREHDSGGAANTAIPGYSAYVTTVRQRFQASFEGSSVYLTEKNMLSHNARLLLLYYRKKLGVLGIHL